MSPSAYEPPKLEVQLTLALGLTVLSPYYSSYVKSLQLRGDERVLDFGSGSGACSRHIASSLQRGGHLDCVDVSAGWMHVVRKTLRHTQNVEYHLGRITGLNLPEAAYDVVVIHFVLHEIPVGERPDVLQALAQRLKPAGRIVLREPQGEGLTAVELERLAASAGLRKNHLAARKILIGSIFDACLIKEETHENLF